MLKLQVFVPNTYTWRPGQHCFLCISALSLLDNHPFTIASAPNSSSNGHSDDAERKGEDVNTLTFLIRPHSGFTRRLSSYTSANTDITFHTFVDGPYGGLSRRIENGYDGVILVAGGGGITASISWLLYLAKCMRDTAEKAVAVKEVKLVWVVRRKEHLLWVQGELEAAIKMAPTGAIGGEFHITGGGSVNDGGEDGDEKNTLVFSDNSTRHDCSSCSRHEEEKAVDAIPSSAISTPTTSLPLPLKTRWKEEHSLPPTIMSHTKIYHHNSQRPSLQAIITQAIHAPRTCILGCGPESMKIDLSNAVAGAQKRVWKGEVKEVKLETETFGW